MAWQPDKYGFASWQGQKNFSSL